MSTVRLIIAYQGTRYHGWQLQPNAPTVQGVLEEAFFQMTGYTTRFLGSSRTDAGVHAAAQVACIDNPSRFGPEELVEGLNALLPEDIVIQQAEAIHQEFDPWRQAYGKHYRFTIYNDRIRPVFERDFCWFIRCELDVELMNRACSYLLGENDFSSFRASGSEAADSIRILDKLEWSRQGPLVVFNAWGRGFLKQMVRNIVGTCVDVGRGFLNTEEMADILESRDRSRAGPTAPACGLCLVKVFFSEGEFQGALVG